MRNSRKERKIRVRGAQREREGLKQEVGRARRERERKGPKQEELEERKRKKDQSRKSSKRERENDHHRWQEELKKIPRQVVGGVQVPA